MMTDRRMRASDSERDATADLLREAYATGRLSRDELDERGAAAFAARTCGELRELTPDLPQLPAVMALPADLVARRAWPTRKLTGGLLVLVPVLAERLLPGAAWPSWWLILVAFLAPAFL